MQDWREYLEGSGRASSLLSLRMEADHWQHEASWTHHWDKGEVKGEEEKKKMGLRHAERGAQDGQEVCVES